MLLHSRSDISEEEECEPYAVAPPIDNLIYAMSTQHKPADADSEHHKRSKNQANDIDRSIISEFLPAWHTVR